MAYLGRGIENLSDRVVLDSLTASATASYTLQLNSVNFVPSSASSLTVSLNGVIQKPDSSYTVSGSTLTFSSALTSSDSIDFIIAERGITLQTPSAGSVGTSQLANLGITNDKIANSTLEVGKVASSLKNTPSFKAHRNSNFSASDSTTTVITFDDEEWDTNSAYDTSNGRFTCPSGEEGKYVFYASARNATSTDTTRFVIVIRKNGTGIAQANNNNGDEDSVVVSAATNLAASDYVDVSIFQNTGATKTIFGDAPDKTTFFGYKLIGV